MGQAPFSSPWLKSQSGQLDHLCDGILVLWTTVFIDSNRRGTDSNSPRPQRAPISVICIEHIARCHIKDSITCEGAAERHVQRHCERVATSSNQRSHTIYRALAIACTSRTVHHQSRKQRGTAIVHQIEDVDRSSIGQVTCRPPIE